MLKDAVLERRITRFTERTAEWKIAEQAAWRRRVNDLFANRAKGHGRQTGSFENVSQRTHGTRAQGSNRGENNHIDTLFA